MPILVAARHSHHRATGLTESHGRFVDGDSAGIPAGAIQHSVTGTTLPMASPMLHPGAVLSSAWIHRAHMWHDALTLVRDPFSPLGLAPIR